MKCKIHPKYKGKSKPKFCENEDCSCTKLYLKLKSKPRAPILPTKTIKDKTKYNRKKKHKDISEHKDD
jgi:hypothetical protein